MKGLWILLLLALNLSGSIHRVARINQYTAEAAQAYGQGAYQQAIAAYTFLRDSLSYQDTRVALNLAHAYRQVGDQELAQELYASLTSHPERTIASSAYLNLGLIQTEQGAFAEGLLAFRQALVQNPANQIARYNYELLKKYLLLHPQDENSDEDINQNQESPPPPPGPGESQQGKPVSGSGAPVQGTGTDNQGSPGQAPPESQGTGQRETEQPSGEENEPVGQEPGSSLGNSPSAASPNNDQMAQRGTESITENDTRAQTINRQLQQMNLSPEKAEMLLQALKEAEMQQIQQLPRKSGKVKESQKPDW